MRYFTLLFFLTLGMRPFGYTIEPVRIHSVDSCIVTLVGDERQRWVTWSDEAWREGDHAEAVIRDGQVVSLRWDRQTPRLAAARRRRTSKRDTLELSELKGDPAEGTKAEAVVGRLLTMGENKRPKPTGHH